ncbi:MAG: Fic family protein [Alphaproteobacteria bacterium]|nr:Fic family protein [Alphaproteobacteria bacterium]
MNDFQGRALPEPAEPAGYSWLIDRYGLNLPLPSRLAAIAGRDHPRTTPNWLLLRPSRRPQPTLAEHLAFAFRREGIDLSVLNTLFAVVPAGEVAAAVRAQPAGALSRRLWFIYEWLTGERLDLPDDSAARYVPAVDTRLQFALAGGERSRRHKVLDNLPGTPAFCPMARRTPALDAARALQLDTRARETAGRVHPDLMARAASFLLLNDTKSSFAIEGERPSSARAARWGRAIAEAGRRAPDRAELERLQRIVIEDARFVRLGLRNEGGFVGLHDRIDGSPLPDHISARPEDLPGLASGIAEYCARAVAGGLDPVVAAAVAAFGFVYVHPFEDGNGRIHRWLIHHVLAAAGYTPPGVVFPVSAAILSRIEDYRRVLESRSSALLPFIDWRATEGGNVEVLNDTAAFYRYFDATAHAEFLYGCIQRTVEEDLPREIRFLVAFDRFAAGVKEMADMPDRRLELLRGFLEQNGGRLSARARSREFAALTDDEAAQIERLYTESFGEP